MTKKLDAGHTMRRILVRLLLGVLMATGINVGSVPAQTVPTLPDDLVVSLAFSRTTYLFNTLGDPIEAVVSLENVGESAIVTAAGFQAEPHHLFLRIRGPQGQLITATELGTAGESEGPPPRVFPVTPSTGAPIVLVQGEPVEFLPGTGDPDPPGPFVLTRTIADLKTFYALPTPGFYEAQVVIPFRAYDPAQLFTSNGVSIAPIAGTLFQGVLQSVPIRFALVADADGDGYCFPTQDNRLCANPQPDCHDGSAAVNPGAAEVPNNGVDDDCNPATTDDPTPPVTTATTAPPPNVNGWNKTAVTVTLTATDAGSGVQSLSYTLSGALTGAFTVLAATTTIPIAPEGVTTVTFFAKDHAGNQESPKTHFVRIDQTAPMLTVPATVTVNATSSAGAVVTFTPTATDNLDPSPQVTCVPPSGSTFPLNPDGTTRTTTVTCTARDAADHTATASFPVIVKGAADQVTDLIEKTKAFTEDTKLENSLVSILTAARDLIQGGKITGACGKLKDYIRLVSAQSGKKLTKAEADELIADAERIKAVLACP